jgi:hypothetical protein
MIALASVAIHSKIYGSSLVYRGIRAQDGRAIACSALLKESDL